MMEYLPELNPEAWGGVTLRDCLNQRTGVGYSFDPAQPDNSMAIHKAIRGLGAPPDIPNMPKSTYDFLK